jgi:hypothetical protein
MENNSLFVLDTSNYFANTEVTTSNAHVQELIKINFINKPANTDQTKQTEEIFENITQDNSQKNII